MPSIVVKNSSKYLLLPSGPDHPGSKGASASYYDPSEDSFDYLPPLGPFSATKGESPGDLDSFIDSRKDGEDWFALYNPRSPRSLNISLVFQVNYERQMSCVRFSKDGLWLATGGAHGTQIFSMRTRTISCTLTDRGKYINSVCFSPDGKYLATVASDGLNQVNASHVHHELLTVGLVFWGTDIPSILPSQIWDIARKCIHHTYKGGCGPVNFSHDGSFIVSSSPGGTIQIWNMNTRKSKVLLINDGVRISKVAISPDDRFVAVASNDKVVCIWDIATGTLVDRLIGHDAMVLSVAFMPDGKGLVSCSQDHTLKYWELSASLRGTHETGGQFSKCMRDFIGHRSTVTCVAISHDGQWITSCSTDCGVQFWDKHGHTHLTLQGHHSVGTRLSLPVF